MTAAAFIESLPVERQAPMQKLYETLQKNLPEGFEESSDTMLHFVVPFSLYPPGYHCPPPQPLPFISLASQKNFIALYHFGLYADPDLAKWFIAAYPKHAKYKLDMGKSCIRFKRMDDIPFELIGDLAARMTPQRWIKIYESHVKTS